MFEGIPSHQPQVLPIGNYWKGGDFMGLEDEINRMIWEGSPVECSPTVKNSRFPEVVGRTRFDTALELLADPASDPVTFKSASRMIAGE